MWPLAFSTGSLVPGEVRGVKRCPGGCPAPLPRSLLPASPPPRPDGGVLGLSLVVAAVAWFSWNLTLPFSPPPYVPCRLHLTIRGSRRRCDPAAIVFCAWLSSFTIVSPGSAALGQFLSEDGIPFRSMDRPHCVCPGIFGETCGLFPPFGFCDVSCYEHGCADVCAGPCDQTFGARAQKHSGSIMWEFYV